MKGQYIQFYTKSKNTKFHMLVEDSGNIIPLDGRLNLGSCCKIATDLCREHRSDGFRIMWKGKVSNTESEEYNTFKMLTDCYKVFPNSVEV